MWWPPRMTKNEPATCSSTAVTYGSHDTTASTLPSLRAGARPNCDQMFSMVRSSYFMPARRNTILKYSSDVCPRASPIRLPLRSATLPALMPVPLRVTIPSGSSALSRPAEALNIFPGPLDHSVQWANVDMHQQPRFSNGGAGAARLGLLHLNEQISAGMARGAC